MKLQLAILGSMTAILLHSLPCRAAPSCDAFQSPQQVEDGLASVDRETRFRAQSCGLASPDRFARGLVIQKLLSGDRIDFVIANAPGDQKSAETVATIDPEFARRVKWSEDGRHFEGYDNGNNSIAGSLIGDTMNVVLSALHSPKGFSACQARLTLNADHTALSGPLVCSQLPGRFTLQIDL